jgi:hypothetical protein
MSKVVIPVLTWNPVLSWIPASAGMTHLRYKIAGAIIYPISDWFVVQYELINYSIFVSDIKFIFIY